MFSELNDVPYVMTTKGETDESLRACARVCVRVRSLTVFIFFLSRKASFYLPLRFFRVTLVAKSVRERTDTWISNVVVVAYRFVVRR